MNIFFLKKNSYTYSYCYKENNFFFNMNKKKNPCFNLREKKRGYQSSIIKKKNYKYHHQYIFKDLKYPVVYIISLYNCYLPQDI